jgi:cytochrome bd-type quinol oxidase subunit 2
MLAAKVKANTGNDIVSTILQFLTHHIGILIALIIILALWRGAGAVLWHLIEAVIVGILVFPSVAPASVKGLADKASSTGQHVGSTGLSLSLLAILVVLLVITVALIARSNHAPLARGVKKMAKQGGGEE